MSFGTLLGQHLKNGTRPDLRPGTLGKQWKAKDFAAAVGGMNERSVRNWLKGKNLPNDLTSIERALFGDNETFGNCKRELRDAFNAVTTADAKAVSDWTDPPYPGLRPFTFEEAPIFFGREREVDALVDRLRNPALRVLAVVGASGTGKSSLVRAGLLPRLGDGAIKGSRNWPVLAFTPGFTSNDPFTALAIALHHWLPPAYPWKPTDIAAALNPTSKAALTPAPRQLSDYIDLLMANRPVGARLVLFIDQFEELFTSATAEHRHDFIELLTHVLDSARLRVVITLRADFLPQCMGEPPLTFAALLQAPAALFPLGPPGPAALLDMIRGPAQRVGLALEEGLADEILKDAGSDPGEALPLIAFCLEELHRRTIPGHRLTLNAYRTVGGLRGAIGRKAGKLLEEIRGTEKESLDIVLAQVFRALVHVDASGRATRQRASREMLMTVAAPVPRLIETLVNGRLLLAENADNHAVIMLTHEALIQEWPALHAWLEYDRARMQRVQRQLLHFASPEIEDRQHAVRALGKIGLVTPEVLPALLTAFGKAERDTYTRMVAARSLGDIGPVAPEVLPILLAAFGDAEENVRVRVEAAEALWQIGPAAADAVPVLVAALDDPKEEVRKAAMRGLQGIGPAAAQVAPALLAVFGDPEQHFDVRAAAIYAFGHIAPAAEAVPALVAALDDPEEEVREAAVNALAIIRPVMQEVITVLCAVRNDPDSTVRDAAASALKRIEVHSA